MKNRNVPQPSDRVAFYGRVSQPKQKLEHQIELGESWAKASGISIPPHLWFTDKGGRRHKSEKREAFQRLLATAEAGKIDWVVVAMFDRWGVKDVDEFFAFRRRLKEAGVRLYSIQDNLELTSKSEGDCWQIFAKAMGAVATMMGHADKNIMKMVERALNGWHLSGSHPFGTDLLCCRLSDRRPLYRLHIVEKHPRLRGRFTFQIHHFDESGKISRIEHTEKMPPRDCKETGYRLAPSIDGERIKAVGVIHRMFDNGDDNGTISKELSSLGFTYYGKGWGYNCIESILGNPAYIGRPAWGKTATGYYRQTFDGKSTEPVERSNDQATQYIKEEKHFVYPREPVFAPDTFMDVELFNRVFKTVKENRGKPRRHKSRDISKHHLAGLLICPDCGAPMDISGTQSKGKRVRYFICSTYVRTRRVGCKANSVKWKYLDQAAESALTLFRERLKVVETLPVGDPNPTAFQSLFKEHLGKCDLVNQLFFEMAEDVGVEAIHCDVDLLTASADEIAANQDAVCDALLPVIDAYIRKHEQVDRDRASEIRVLEEQLDRLADRAGQAPTQRQADRLWAQSVEVEKKIDRLRHSGSPLWERMELLVSQADTLKQSLSQAGVLQDARLWRNLVESITPVWRENRKPREPNVGGFVFTPKSELEERGIGAMEIFLDRTGKGSSP